MIPSPQEALAEARGEQSDEPVELPAVTRLSIDITGERGKRYKADFTYTVPNLGMQVEIAKLKAVYLPNGAMADPNGFSLVEQVAYLMVCIDQSKPKELPEWWKDIWALYDATPISALYKEAALYEARFHGRATAPAQREEGEGVDQQREGRDEGGDDPAAQDPLGEAVQRPAQRRKTLASSGG